MTIKLLFSILLISKIVVEFTTARSISNNHVEILDPPDKSELDKKEYRLLKIKENGLTALLISDKYANDSDAQVGLTVGIGSSHDILIQVPGMAHFLEHMLFMGSEKYPEENSFDKYISANGGSPNAKTEYEYTLYYYSVSNKELDGALDRFAQFFIKPLLLKESMTRERESIESEFQGAKENFFVRYEQMLTVLANTSHPVSYFSWGNLKSLKEDISDDELYDKVHKFFKSFYVPANMFLSVQSPHALDELENMVVNYFEEIPSSRNIDEVLTMPQFNWEDAMTSEFHEKIIYVKSLSEQNRMVLTWILPSYLEDYRYKVLNYLSFLLGDETAGSLASYLQNELYATAVQVEIHTGNFKWNSEFSLYSLYISLTDYGYGKIDDVLEAVFSYLLFLKESGPNEDFYKDIQQIKSNEFRFDTNSRENAAELSSNMRVYGSKDIITGPKLFFEYNEDLVKSTIDHLNQGKMNLMIFTTKEEFNEIEPWMQIKYRKDDFPEKYRKMWKNRKLNSSFFYPTKNNFISTNFEIFSDPDGITEYPENILNSQCLKCWYRLDDKFHLPKAIVNVFFEAPNVANSYTLLKLYTNLIDHLINDDLYAAKQTNYAIEFETKPNGIELSLSGYNEKIDLVLDVVMNIFRQFSKILKVSTFDIYKKELKSDCHEELLDVQTQNVQMLNRILDVSYSGCYNVMDQIDEITIDDLKKFSEIFLDTMKTRILAQGNLMKSHALHIAGKVIKNSNCSAETNERKTRKIPQDKRILKLNSHVKHSCNSAIQNYYQIGKASIENSAVLELFMALLKEPIFNILRTQYQLGYSVSAKIKTFNNVLGFTILVNSQEDKNSYNLVYDKIEDFLVNKVKDILEDMSDDEFNLIKGSLIQKKIGADIELQEEFNRNWDEILRNDYMFDRPKKLVEAIGKLKLSDIREFYKQQINNPELRELSIQVVGSNGHTSEELTEDSNGNKHKIEIFTENPEERTNSIDRPVFILNIEEFIDSLTYYDNLDENKNL